MALFDVGKTHWSHSLGHSVLVPLTINIFVCALLRVKISSVSKKFFFLGNHGTKKVRIFLDLLMIRRNLLYSLRSEVSIDRRAVRCPIGRPSLPPKQSSWRTPTWTWTTGNDPHQTHTRYYLELLGTPHYRDSQPLPSVPKNVFGVRSAPFLWHARRATPRRQLPLC